MAEIIVLTQYMNIGGLERFACSLSAELQRQREWDPLVCYYDEIERLPSLKGQLLRSGVRFQEFKKGRGVSFKLVRSLLRLAKVNQVQVIHTHDLGPLMYGVAVRVLSLFRIQIVHTQHSFFYSMQSRKYGLYERVFSRFAKRVVCVSPEIQNRYLKIGLNGKRLTYIPNGVVFPNQPVRIAEKSTFRRELLLDHSDIPNGFLSGAFLPSTFLPIAFLPSAFLEERWLLCLARIHTGKGQPQVLKIWAALPEKVRKTSILLFIGPETSPGLVETLKREISELPDGDRIFMLGASLDPQKWIQASDLFVSGSESEGMPLAALEAIGSGLPGLLSAIPGHQIFTESGSSFVQTFPLKTPETGADWIESQLARRMADEDGYIQQAWTEASGLRSRFGISQMVEKYSQIYRKGQR